MATTTNFGWETPDDTDLVKDGAAAMRTLGNSIDASFVDLKGGTTGQVLSKNSNTDLDFTWVAQDDSNAIQNSIVDAKADLITATANDTPARLAVGSDYAFLQADSSTATGLIWDNATWTTYTPTVSANSGTFTSAAGFGRYKRIGKTVFALITVTITTNGTAAGNVAATLPFNSQGSYNGIYRETNSTGNAGQVETVTDKLIYRTFTNGYPGANNYTLAGTIVYEVA